MKVGPGGGVVVLGTLLSDEIPILLNSVRPWCQITAVRIELALGSLPITHLFGVLKKGVNNINPWARG